MTNFKIGFPCGHVIEIDNTHVKGHKHNGVRPNSLRITGDFPEEDYEWQSHILHPHESTMVHNDKVIYLNGERVNHE